MVFKWGLKGGFKVFLMLFLVGFYGLGFNVCFCKFF